MAFETVVGRTDEEVEDFGTKGSIFLGKQYVSMGAQTSLSNKVYMDIASSHVVFVCGKRGSGKCVTGDTLITLDNGEKIPIKDLKDRKEDILSLDDELNIDSEEWNEFFERDVDKLLEVKLKSGKEIKLTPEHPLLTVKGWKEVQKLDEGDRVATPREEKVFGDKSLPEHKIKLIAYFLSEGHLSNRNILFSNSDDLIIDDFKKSVKEFNPDLEVKDHGESNGFSIRNRNRKVETDLERDENGRFKKGTKIDTRTEMRRWLEKHDMYGKLADEREIPECIYKLPREQLSLFLNRLFSCDGSLFKSDCWSISYSSSSEEFIKGVSHLLLRFGIVSKIREKYSKEYDSKSYEIEIRGEFVSKYLNKVGFFGEKESIEKKALEETTEVIRNPNDDTIPKDIWDDYKPDNWAETARKMDYDYEYPKSLRESKNYAPSRQKLKQIAKADENPEILQIAESDIFWDEIESINVKEGDFTVYDISVPETHNFVANDIIVHNSYTLGVIAEGMADLDEVVRDNLSIILFDTMGVYWTMKYPNHKDPDLLDEWGLDAHGLDVQIFTPSGFYEEYKERGVPTDAPFTIRPSDLSASDWNMTFDFEENSPEAGLMFRIVHKLGDEKDNFSIKELVEAAEEDDKTNQEVKQAVINNLHKVEDWGIFSTEGTPLKDLAQGGQVTVLDLSAYATLPNGWLIKSLVTGLISKKLFNQRMVARKKEEFDNIETAMHYFSEENDDQLDYPLVWLVIDEAHEMLPSEGKTTATDPLVTILREGRQPGISLILASQQPGKIHTDVMTQSDTVLSHRLTAQLDVKALQKLTQTYMQEGLTEKINNMPRVKGAAVLFDDMNERINLMQVRPRFTWHGGEAPNAMPSKPAMISSLEDEDEAGGSEDDGSSLLEE